MVKLIKAANYYNQKTKSENVSIENFITTDNILPNKAGITLATNLSTGTMMPAFKPDHTLVANIRPYLKKIWLSDREGGCSADVLVFQANEGFDPKYIYYSLSRDDFFKHMMRGKKGTKMPRGDKKHIMEFLIPDYSYPEQQKIAKVLSAIDAKIESNKKINSELELMARTIYDYWFVQFDFPNEVGKPYKTSGGTMVWNEDLNIFIPYGWGIIRIEDLLSKESNAKKILSSEILSKGMIPVVDQSSEYIAGYTEDEEALIKADVPKIIFGDHTKIVKFINFDFARGADGTQVLMSNNTRMPQHLFFYSILKVNFPNSGYERYFKYLKDSVIILPGETIAQRYKTLVKKYYDKIKLNIFLNRQLIELREWLLPLLMNGQIKVS
jgi:type I restriction enzyme S subunit